MFESARTQQISNCNAHSTTFTDMPGPVQTGNDVNFPTDIALLILWHCPIAWNFIINIAMWSPWLCQASPLCHDLDKSDSKITDDDKDYLWDGLIEHIFHNPVEL